jgi:hypothetical protein
VSVNAMPAVAVALLVMVKVSVALRFTPMDQARSAS